MRKQTQTVAIIGGGPTGIGIGRELRDGGIDFEIFEAADDFGGVWNSAGACGRTYPSLHLISPKFNTQVADFPMPEDYPDYPSHELMLRYIRSYAKAFGMYERTRFGSKVARLEPVGSEWRVTTAKGESAQYPLVVVANGLQRIPRFPKYPGQFDGESIHSSQYKTAEQVRGKRVLVVGGGNSGCDMAVDAVHHAAAVYHSTRRGYYYQPKFVGGKPTPQWMMELGNKFPTKQETLAYIQETFRLAGFDGTDYGLPKPDYPLDAAHPIMNSQILYHIGHGDIRAKGDIASFEGRRVRFVDGEEAEFDVVIYATGYDRDLSFLDRGLLEWKSGIPSLFLHSVPRNLDNLLFMGFINSAAGLGDGLKTQGHFVRSYARAYFGQTSGLAAFLAAKRTDDPDIGQGYFVDSHRHLWEADLWKLLAQMRKYRDMLEESAPAVATVAEAAMDLPTVEREVLRLAAAALGVAEEELDPTVNLSRYGVDSIAITEVMVRISRHFGISVAPTTFFEAKHFRDLSSILVARYGKAMGKQSRQPVATPPAGDEPASWIARHRRVKKRAAPTGQRKIAIIAMDGVFPKSADLDALEGHLRRGDDCIEEIPADRWDWRSCYGDPKQGPYSNVKYGGFVPNHDRFDAAFFHISPREAELMDPQHRLYLECVWRLFERGGYAAGSLAGKKVGMFLGINLQDYTDMVNRAGIRDAVQLTGLGHMFCPNRLSFLFDIHGPSEVIDTACSSSLVAVHRAVMSILHEGCEMAVAGGANLMLTPTQHIMFSKVGMLAEDGRCKTFSREANGYVRSEGIGAVLLKPLEAAERDGDPILGVILGSAENHGGAATSLTAPNPKAQAELIVEAHRQAALDPRSITAIECHGTGTSLGDPIEVEGLKSAFARLYQERGLAPAAMPHCGLGSVKSNIGHAETAAGIAGLMKLVLGMQSGWLYRTLHCENQNPLIDLAGSPFRLLREAQPWTRPVIDGVEHPRRAGVSSFGAGGANAHIVLEEYRGSQTGPPSAGSFVIPLSAKSQEALDRRVKQLADWIAAHENCNLRDLAYTLQVGRDAMRVRMAYVVSDVADLQHQLRGPEQSRPSSPLAERWVRGEAVDWESQYAGQPKPQRLALPAYPFAAKRYWLPVETAPEHFTRSFDGRESFLRDHRVGGQPVLPGVMYLELVCAALRAAGRAAIQIRQAVWMKPLVVSGPVKVEVRLEPRVEIASVGADGTREVHFQARLGDSALTEAAGVAPLQGGQFFDGGEIYRLFDGMGIQYGPTHRAIQSLRAGAAGVTAELRLPGEAGRLDEFTLHPSLLDAALQSALGMQVGDARTAALPFALESISIAGSLTEAMVVHVRPSEKRGALDLDLANASGQVAVRLRGFVTRAIAPASDNVFFFAPAWQRLPESPRNAVSFDERIAWVAGPPGRLDGWTWQRFPSTDFHACFQSLLAELQRIAAAPSRRILLQVCVAESSRLLALSAMLRSARMECSWLWPQIVVVPDDRDAAPFLAEASALPQHGMIRFGVDGKAEVRCWERPTLPEAAISWRPKGVYLITGGGGSLARMLARHIAEEAPGASIVLAGRTVPESDLGGSMWFRRTDVTKADEVESLIAEVRQRHGRIDGVFHAAGVLDDAPLLQTSAPRALAVMAPKVDGAIHLDRAIADAPLDFFVLFGSVAGVLGNAGQSAYAAANAYLDVFAAERQATRPGRTVAVDWPLWRDGGMRMDESTAALMRRTTGLDSLTTPDGLLALRRILGSGLTQVMVACGDAERIARYLAATPELPTVAASKVDQPALRTKVMAGLVDCVCQLLKLEPADLSPDTELTEYGFDSITFTQFANALNDRFDLEVTPTLFFEFPTLQQLADGLIAGNGPALSSRLGVKAVPVAPAPQWQPEAAPAQKQPADAVAIIGMSGAFPMAKDLDAFWRNLVEGRDAIGEVPPDRWDWKAYWGDPAKEPGRTNVKWGGFMENVAEFDAAFFGISPPEARAMDPQQRLLLTQAWRALEDAGIAPRRLAGSNTGVFIGIADTGYSRLMAQAGASLEGYVMTGLAPSLGPNRISHFLNLHGPSVAVETACSSSLVAVSRAMESIRSGACDCALAGGVNTLLLPDSFIGFTRAGMLSPDGRCKAFASSANGYARGEGVGLVVLKRLELAERDGDRILAVIRAAAENHGGRAGSLTAPNPKAQAELLRTAYTRAGFDPRTVTYLEAHGTGTSLGDPIEVEALTAAFADLSKSAAQQFGAQAESACAIGTVKASIGHLELAAGIAGLIKVLLQMRHRTIVGVLHCDQLNPYLKLDGTRFHVAQRNEEWRRPVDEHGRELPLRAGVSSFGFGGSNAHLALEEYVAPAAQTPAVSSPEMIVLSARTPEQLTESAQSLATALSSGEYALTEVAYTLQCGRDAMEHRLAFVAASIREVVSKLQAFVSGTRDTELHVGSAKANREMLTALESDEEVLRTLATLPQRGKHDALLSLWVRGLPFAWRSLHGSAAPRRTALPGYPFATTRYWVEQATPPLTANVIRGDDWFIRDHVVDQQPVLPGVMHLEMVRNAVVRAGGWGGRALELRQHTWLRPVTVNGDAIRLSVSTSASPDGSFAYELRSSAVHSMGSAVAVNVQTPRVDLDLLRQQASRAIAVGESYQRFASLGLQYGPAQRALHGLFAGTDFAVAELRMPEGTNDGAFLLHPSLLDGALQALIGLEGAASALALPYAVRRVQIFSEANARTMWAVARRESASAYQIDVCQPDGTVCVRMEGLAVRRAPVEKAPQVSTLAELVRIAAKVLEVDASVIETDVELGEFGFDSITMTAFASKVNSELGLSLTPADFFEFATLERLAGHIGERSVSAPVTLQSAPAEEKEDAIAIVGMSCHFPMAPDAESFWRNLREGRDCITEVPADRWDWRAIYGDPKQEPGKTNVQWGGFADGILDFDPLFFGISPREASWMDPQQRLLLMHVWKALEDAGHAPRQLAGRSIGIFVGTSMSSRTAAADTGGESYAATGAVPSVGPNRASYFFDWHGPSEPVETACSSSLVAIHRAVQAMRSGDCEMAVVGGINTMVTPEAHILFSQAGMLSPDGRCKTFSAGANGYVRGEGVGMLVLKRLSQARRDSNSIYAIVRGTAVNHGGRANSLTAPNTAAQSDLLKTAYQRAGVDPSTVTYIEAHGTGTALGDPVEVNALKSLFQKGDGRCALGSVKTNIGHLELAAGVAGLIKVLLQMQHRTLAPTLHCDEQNPYIDFSGSPLYLVREAQTWEGPRRAGVSSFGFGGVNAHVIVEEYEQQQRVPGFGPALMVLSAREEDRLRALARSLADSFGERYSDADLQDASYTLLVGRDAMKYRLAVVVQTAVELRAKLQAFANGQVEGVLTGCVERKATAPAMAGSTLEAMGRHWVNGGELDLDAMFERGQRRLLHLPTYPFATTRPASGIVLDPAAYYLRDHRIHSQSVLPGAMSLELVRTAFGEAVPVTMRQILWRQPVIVESQPVAARVDLDAAKGSFRFVTGEDTVHVQGFIAAGAEEGGHIDVEAIRSRCREQITSREFYAVFEPSGIAYGPSFRPVEEAFAGEVEALTKLRLPKSSSSHSAMHPVMLDGAFQSCALLLRGLGAETAVPFAVERLEVLRPTADEMWVHVRETLSAGASIRRVDIDLADGDGRVCVKVRGFSLRTMTTPSPQPPRQQRVRDTRALLARLVAEESGVSRNSISSEEPLEAYGLDSMMIGKLTDRLEREYGPLSKTLFFEYQNIEQLARYLDEEHAPLATPRVQAKPAADGAIAIIGLAGRYPGARNLDEFWENLARGRDCITEVPRSRWDHSRYYDPESRAPGKTNSKWGGFIDDAECFDPLFFNVSPREAEFLDPQERIFLQCAWEAMEDAGYTRATLAPAAAPMTGGNVGVFVGVMYEEYQLWGAEMTAAGRPTVLSSSAASIANRVSYFCDFHGPSLTVDTMCSSSLTAIHLACESLRAGSCQLALAGGVNLNLHPNKYLTLAQGRFTSTTGRCESYGRGGDGYVPGEGAGAVILKPLERAIADGDQIYGVVRASALNHGGKTNGYTVPNPHAQAAVITAALERGGVDARAISYIEGHGTGTSLGDPIEIAALSKAFRAHTQEREFCAIGSVKSNIGHCESAAGIAGLTKVLLQMKHGMLAPSLHSETLNPAIDFPRSPFRVQRRLEAWPRPESGARLAGISAFGAGGSNVHLVVEEHESPARQPAVQRPRVFPFSAHTEEQLTALLERHLAAFARYTDQDLPAIARVLQEGREVFAQRFAVVASTLADLHAQTAAYLNNEQPSLPHPDALWRVAREWMEHGKTDWAALREAEATRVSLPTYPFAKERFWAPLPGGSPAPLPLFFAPSWQPQLAQPVVKPDSVVTVFVGVDSTGADGIRIPGDDYTSAAVELLGVVQDIVKERPKSALLQVVVPAGSELAGLGGLLRTVQWEHSAVRCQLVEWDGAGGDLAGRLRAERFSGETHTRYTRESQRQVRQWRELTAEPNVATPWKDGGVYLIVGGAGGLGLLLAEEIASSVRRPALWLTSRSPMAESARAGITKRGGVVEHRQVDVTERPQVDGLIREILERHGRLDGVIHAAGVLRDKRLVRKSAAEFREVLAPKVEGVLNLDAATAGCRMDFVLLFASISGALGNAGQCDYAAANGFLDSFAACRNLQVERGERYGRTISLDWPYWSNGGMRLDDSVIERMRSGFGVVPLETDAGMAALRAAFGFRESQLLILDGDRDRLRHALRPPQVVAAPAPPPKRDDLTGRIRHHLSRVLQVPPEKLSSSETLDRYGLDSVTGMDVIESLSRELDRKLPPTLLLEYPRIDLLAAHLNETVPAPAIAEPVAERGKDIAIIAIAGRYPGADTIDDFWDLLQQGRDCITEIPGERWDANSRAAAYCKWGGFLSDVDRFDASFFGVSPRDAALMDPQERLFLETVFRLLESAGYTNAHLRQAFGSRVGVYVGAMSQQYHAVEADPDQKALVSMSSYASIANRVSFYFDLQGPSVALDTMCSSGLHAVHLASRALQADECRLAIAGGVNLSIHPNKYQALSRTGLLGSTPDSRSFADGDGYLPAEGVGAVLLKPLADARRDGDRILAVIKGSAANHGGHSAGFMTPSAEAQARLIEENFRATGVDPRTVSYVEAAATGSALSDSMEVRALTRAFRNFTKDVGFCALGTVKSNMGHAEAASGMAQLTKVILQLDRRKLAPTLLTRHPNPHIDLNGTPFVLQSSLTEWTPPNGVPRRAAISSFGAGGSNLHLILEEAPTTVASEESMAGPPWQFVLSAHSDERLAQWMKTMHDYVANHTALSLPRLAYTLQERRTRMECVRVISSSNRQQLLDALAAPERHALRAEAGEPSGVLRGAPLPLPPYPLQRERYWLSVSKDAGPAPATLPERIVALLQEELGVPVQATDSFQSLGIDSMASQRLIHAVSESTGVPIGYADLASHPTPATLASYLGGIQPAARNGSAPEREFPCSLTEGQRALWVFQKLYPSSSAYNVPLAYAVEHADRDALERACGWVVKAYPILGTLVDGDLQLRLAERAARLQVLQVPPSMDAVEFARQRAAVPFDLQEAVPIRFELLDGLTPILLIVVHHIAFDGISAAVFAKAFWQAYCGREEFEKPVAASFASFSEWEQQYLASSAAERDRNWWLNHLAGEVPTLNLAAVGSSASLDVELPAGLVAQVKSCSAELGISASVLFLGAFAILLSRYCDAEEFVVGVPAAARPQSGFQETIGYFANVLPLRVAPTGAHSVADYLGALQTTFSAALDHSQYPLARLLRDMKRDALAAPLFHATFSYQSFLNSLELAGTQHLAEIRQEGDAAFGLEVHTSSIVAVYDAQQFNDSSVRSMLVHYIRMLGALVANPRQPVADLQMLTQLERDTILGQWSRGEELRQARATVCSAIDRRSAAVPNAVAIVADQESWTYSALAKRVNRLTNYLRQRALPPGARVAVCLGRAPECVAVMLAVWKAGCVWVPLDSAWPAERLAFTIRDSGAALVIVDDSTVAALNGVPPARLILLSRAQNAIARCSAKPARYRTPLTSDAYIIYTSGSTGRPKGVVVSHAALATHCVAAVRTYGITRRDVVLQFSSHSVDPALEQLLPALMQGAMVVMRTQDLWTPSAFQRLIHKQRITVADLPPAYLHELLLAWPAGATSHGLRLLLCGGESLPPDTVRLWQASPLRTARLLNVYGPTEATITSTYHEVTAADAAERSVPIGRPFPAREIYILDRYGNPVPEGVAGELYIGGPCLGTAYQGSEELTRSRFTPNPFSAGRLYRTGDRASFVPGTNGLLAFHGRTDQQVKVRGFRVELGEVESALREFGCSDAAVFLDPSSQQLMACVTPDSFDEAGARVYLASRLPAHMLPVAYLALERLPLSLSGKVDRQALRLLFADRGESRKPSGLRSMTEQRLERIWCSLLQLQMVNPEESFFDLGGHSLLCLRLLAEMQREFQRELSIGDILQAPTLREMAVLLDRDAVAMDSPLVTLREAAAAGGAPLFLVHPVGGSVACYAELAKHLDMAGAVFGLQSPLLTGSGGPQSLEEIAALYVDEIRAVQPEGPYRLAGWSLGGMIAYEIARQLRSEGSAVNLLALIDSYPPSVVRQWAEQQLPVVAFAEDLLGGSLEGLDTTQPEGQVLEALSAKLQVDCAALFRVFRLHLDASRQYVPRAADISITLVEAGTPAADLAAEWGALALSGITVYRLSASHYNILQSPQVQRVAEILTPHAISARAAAGAPAHAGWSDPQTTPVLLPARSSNSDPIVH